MRILQLCCFTDLWDSRHEVESIDLKMNQDVFNYPDKYANEFDLVVAAPPCKQFTLANTRNWVINPKEDIRLAKKCLSMCMETGLYWLFENPVGRIEDFIPELTKYRICTWTGEDVQKRDVLYGNFLILIQDGWRYDYKRSKKFREKFIPGLIKNVENCLTNTN